jgi:hypothetical protein
VVSITHDLDAELDWSAFEFGRFGIGDMGFPCC